MLESLSYSVSIHLGASSLSLLIIENLNGHETELEYLDHAVPFARDIFRYGRVKRDTIERAVDILDGYIKTLSEYGLQPSDVQNAALTNIANEAKNQHVILSRLQISSGITFHTLTSGGMTRLIFEKIRRRQIEASFTNIGKTLAIHVGPGNTRVLMLNNGRVERFSTYRLGTHRTAEQLRQHYSSGKDYLQYIRKQCAQVDAIKYDFKKEGIENFILIGLEIQLVSEHLGDGTDFKKGIESYSQFLDLAAEQAEEERVVNYALDYHSEDGFLPALQINYSLLHAFSEPKYWVPKTDYSRGILKDLAITKASSSTHLEPEILHACRFLAQKYDADPNHYEHICVLVTELFEKTKELHELSDWDLVLLKAATIVHEIGGYISPRMHHKHSYYLINNSEIFGLDDEHRKIVALIARYHRQSSPKTTHKEYMSLTKEVRITISKLSSLLRIADALDISQQQKIKRISVELNRDTLKITTPDISDLNLERMTLKSKGDLFEELFGLDIKLEHTYDPLY